MNEIIGGLSLALHAFMAGGLFALIRKASRMEHKIELLWHRFMKDTGIGEAE